MRYFYWFSLLVLCLTAYLPEDLFSKTNEDTRGSPVITFSHEYAVNRIDRKALPGARSVVTSPVRIKLELSTIPLLGETFQISAKIRSKVSYRYTSAYDHREHTERLSPHKLIARLASHIPSRYEHSIRYCGVYANRSRGARRARAPAIETGTSEEKPLPTRWKRQWQQLLQCVFHVTLTCPHCDTEMKVLAVITQKEPIHKILDHLKSKKIDPRAGPFAHKAA